LLIKSCVIKNHIHGIIALNSRFDLFIVTPVNESNPALTMGLLSVFFTCLTIRTDAHGPFAISGRIGHTTNTIRTTSSCLNKIKTRHYSKIVYLNWTDSPTRT